MPTDVTYAAHLLERALAKVRDARTAIPGRLPIPAAEECLDDIDDAFAAIILQLTDALAAIDLAVAA
jgi:hypothetical protein